MPDIHIVKDVFKKVAARYNFVNSVLTFGIDGLWRKAVAKEVLKVNPASLCDLATGSGVLAFTIAREFEKKKRLCNITGFDISPELLEVAKRDLSHKKFNSPIQFLPGDALALPLPDACVDAVTIGFGLRNFESRERGYKEILRILKPGGYVFILEFSQPRGLMRILYSMYQPFIPLIARLLGSDPGSYEYLNRTVKAFPDAPVIAKEMQAAGFKNIEFKRLTGGIVALHIGSKIPLE